MALILSKPAPELKNTVIEASAPGQKKQPSKPSQKQVQKKEESPRLSGTAAEIMAAIRKNKGDKVIVHGNETERVERIPTGVFEFDFYTGGGIPRGRQTILYGPESSNKTNIALLLVAQAQRLPAPCNVAVWVDVEQVWDATMASWAAELGVDVSRLLVIKPAYGEEAVDLTDAMMRAEDVAIVVVDSIAPLIAVKEIEQSAENFDVGTSALMIKRMSNKISTAFGEERRKNHFPAVVLINQIRFKIGVIFGNPETMPGGEAVKFASSMRIRLSATNKVVKSINEDVHSFKETHCIMKKAKVPVLSNDFKFDLCVYSHDSLKAGESDSFGMVLNYLKQLGTLQKVPKGYSIEGERLLDEKGDSYGLKVWKTQDDIKSEYYADIDFRLRLQKKVIDAFADKTFYVDEPQIGPKDLEPGKKVDLETGEILEEESAETIG